jgi:hypothetical protein
MSDLSSTRPDVDPREPRWAVRLLFVLVVLVVPVLVSGIAVDRFPTLSVLDEPAHIDYLRRIEQGEVPRIGDKMLPDTARDVACRTINGRMVSDCGLDEIPIEDLDALGFSYEAQQPPLYYVVTAALRQPISLVVNGFVNSARLTGAVWLAGGLALLWWYLRRRLGATAVAAATACVLVSMAPMVVGQSYTVNNDASAVLIGAATLVGYDRLRRDPSGAAVALAVVGAAVVVLVKPLAILPVGAASLALLLGALVRREGFRAIAVLMLPAVAALVTYQGWEVVRDARAVVPYSEVTDALLVGRAIVDEYPLDVVGSSLTELLTGYGDRIGVQPIRPAVAGFAAMIGLLLVYGPSVATALGRGRRELQHLHIGILTVALAAPVLLITQSYLAVHRDGGSNSRYALALIPMMTTAVVAWMDDSRGLRRAAVVGACLLLAVTVIGVSTHEVAT